MAKNIGKLAGLAALAGAAYMMSKGKDATGPAATAAEKDASEARTKAQRDAVSGNKSAENKLETPAETIARSDKSAEKYNITDKNYSNEGYGKGINQAGASGTTTLGPGYNKSDKPEPPKSSKLEPKNEPPKSLNPVSEPSDKSIKLAPEKRDLEAGMSRGTRTPAKPVSTVSSSEEGMKNYKPRRTPAAPSTAKSTVSSSAEGMKNYKPRSTSAAPAATKVAEKPTEKSKNMLEAAKEEARRRAAASQTTRTSTSSSTSPATRTPFPGSSALNKKRGGAVKMASGGMTASRRADGIASRGKTRCKMY